ncbi:MAG: DUF1501 domain-containing protein [Verrucomicrobiia bacterium]|jgi:hypothetical protein
MNPLDSNSARFSKFTRNLALGAALAMTSLADANSPVTDADIIPILLRRCANCHGGEYKEADLDLRTLEGIRAGGKSGAVINPGKPDKSPLIQKIEADEMPPKKIRGRAGIEQVTEGELAKLRQWITDGAVAANPFGRDDPGKKATPQELPWSFKSPTKPTPPDVRAANLVRNPIDAFLLRKLEAKNLTFSPEANRLTLLRRATFALTGLPPTPEQIDAFVDDDTPGAYERLIDRLLDSPRYGESWGRFWLDLAGYADSEGKRSADMIRPYAWKYRDSLPAACVHQDKPVAALMTDLKQRGLMDSTLVLWGGEFGRLPMAQGKDPKQMLKAGRDHGPWGFTTLMAGAGVKGGTTYGSTDEFGFAAVDKRVSIQDWHATLLHLLGMDHEKLFLERNGLHEKLTHTFSSRIVHEILA